MTPLTSSASPTHGSNIRVLSYADFVSEANAEPAGYLWDCLLPRAGIALLAGEAFAGKTTLVALLAGALAGKHELAGRAVQPGRMLLCALEHGRRPLAVLLKDVASAAGVAAPAIDIVPGPFCLDDPAQVAALKAEADRLGSSVIVIDPLRRAGNADENSSQEIAEIHRQLLVLTGGNQRLVVVTHHLGKNGNVRGSTDLLAMADTVIRLSRHGDRVRLVASHHAAEETNVEYRVHREPGLVTAELVGAPARNEDQSIARAIHRVLEVRPNLSKRGLRAALKAQKVRTSHAEIDRQLSKMTEDGVIENTGKRGKGSWSLRP